MAAIPRRTHTTKAVNLCLDLDALALVETLVPGRVGMGRLLSELIRKEARERAQRPDLLATLRRQTAQAVQEEVVRAID